MNRATTQAQKDRIEVLIQAGVKEKFAERAVVERGLTAADMTWNGRLGRPPHWIETVHPEVEIARRAAWTRSHPGEP